VQKGIGIPENDHQILLEPFYSTKKEGHHLGMGLAFVKQYLDSIGASLSYSNEREGTVFTITLNEGITRKE